MTAERIEKISKVAKKLKPAANAVPEKGAFEAQLEARRVQKEDTTAVKTPPTQKEGGQVTSNLLDEVRDLNQRTEHLVRSNPQELAGKVEDIVAQIDTLKDTLEKPNVTLRGSVREILRNKLAHIDENLKVALEKANIEYVPPEKPKGMANPIDRFLGLLTHGQEQLSSLAQDVRAFSLGDKEISPANMLLIQIKVTYIQQEIELFTSMLNKALESTKSMLNVQV
jgi:hypothetical protein